MKLSAAEHCAVASSRGASWRVEELRWRDFFLPIQLQCNDKSRRMEAVFFFFIFLFAKSSTQNKRVEHQTVMQGLETRDCSRNGICPGFRLSALLPAPFCATLKSIPFKYVFINGICCYILLFSLREVSIGFVLCLISRRQMALNGFAI